MLTWQGTDDDGNFEISRADAAVLAMSGLCGLDPDRIPACAAVGAAEVQAAYDRGYDDGYDDGLDAATPTGSTPPPDTAPPVTAPPELPQRQSLFDLTGVRYGTECLQGIYAVKTKNERLRGIYGASDSRRNGFETFRISQIYMNEPVFIPHLFPDKAHPIHGSNDPGYGYADPRGYVCTHLNATGAYHPNAPTLDRADAQLTTMCLLTYNWPYDHYKERAEIRVLEPERISLEGTAAAAAIRFTRQHGRLPSELRPQLDDDSEDCLKNGISVVPATGPASGGDWAVVEPREPWTADPLTQSFRPPRSWLDPLENPRWLQW